MAEDLKVVRRGTRMDDAEVGHIANRSIDENGIQWVKSRCWGCHCNCGILVGVAPDGTISELRPNEEQGTVFCDRLGEHGERMIKFHYHKDRVNSALKRVGEKGSGEWEEIPYEQALDEIAAKLAELKEKYGPETLVIGEGTYRSGHLWARSRFTNLFGNPGNLLDPGQICWCWIYTINMALCGYCVEVSVPAGIVYSNCIVIWGVNPHQKWGPKAPYWRLMETILARKELPRIIVVDPEGIELTRHADYWMQPRPGTDLSLMLAWCNVILSEGYYDTEFLSSWTNGTFLLDAETKQLVRADDLSESGSHADFVSWNAVSGEPLVWNSDECRYYGDDPECKDVALEGQFEITLKDGSKLLVETSFTAIKEGLASYTPEWASEISGVPARKIRESALCYATAKPGVIVWGIGGGDQHGYNATYSALCKQLLRAFTGNVDVLGGDMVLEPGPFMEDGSFPLREAELEMAHMVSPEAREKLLGGNIHRLVGWQGFEPMDACYQKMWQIPRPMVHQLLASACLGFRAMLSNDPYPVRAMIAWGSNPMCWASNSKLVYKALKSLDLLVVVDYWITPTAAIADYIMPAADWMERPTCTTCEDSMDYMNIGDRAVVPEGDRHVDYDFFRGLGIRLGQEEYWPWPTYEDSIEYRTIRAGFTYEEAVEIGSLFSEMHFQKHLNILPNGQRRGFATPSRKFEIFSSVIQDLDFNPIPYYRELPESPISDPELAEKYPIVITTGGRFNPMFHSEFRQLGLGTRESWPWPYFTINRVTAQDRCIRDGDWCWIENQRGRIRQRAKLTTSIAPGVITAQASWWYPELPMTDPNPGGIFESNVNVLTSDEPDALDPMCGCWQTRGLMCEVYRCDEPFPSEHLVPQTPDFEEAKPVYIEKMDRNVTPMGPLRTAEENFGPYGKEWGTCPAPEGKKAPADVKSFESHVWKAREQFLKTKEEMAQAIKEQ